jgi:hypothetical protein
LNQDTVLNLVDVNGKDEFLFNAATDKDSTDEEITTLLRSCARSDFDIEIIASKPWMAGRALVAGRYGGDRIFIAGDAAHLFTPTGGFGMNTGIEDAANLAWKLAAVLEGWGGPALLHTYEIERRPIGIRNTGVARAHALSIRDIPLSAALDEDTVEGEAARAKVSAIIPAFREEFASIGIQLGARYDGSPVIAKEAGAEPPEDDLARYEPTSLPGGRAPHVWMPNGRSLYDHLGTGFSLLRFAPNRAAEDIAVAAQKRGIPLLIVDVPMPEARALYPCELTLIRPDQYVAWRGNSVEDADTLLRMVTGW